MSNNVIRVIRKKQLFNKKRNILIYSDNDELIASIANGESKMVPIDININYIYLKIDWIKSKRITINNLGNKKLFIETNIKDKLIYISIIFNIISMVLIFLKFYILSVTFAFFSFSPFLYYFFINNSDLFKIEYK